jgi:hypothetical protein
MSHDGTQVAGATGRKLIVWEEDGTRSWSWHPPKKHKARISSVFPSFAGTSLIVAAGRRVYRVDGHDNRQIFHDKSKPRREGSLFVDGIVSLGDGSVAYQTVEIYDRRLTINPKVTAMLTGDPEGIGRRALKSNLETIEWDGYACYRPALERALGARGRLVLKLSIGDDGLPSTIEIDQTQAKRLGRTTDCMRRELKSRHFSAAAHGKAIEVTVSFRLGAVPKDDED